MGVTIAAVIHQPSYEIFQMFDDVLLLAKGGRTAFYGPEAEVQGYFEGLGYALPQRTNPADVYMDIIAGIRERADGPALSPAVSLSDATILDQIHNTKWLIVLALLRGIVIWLPHVVPAALVPSKLLLLH